MGTLSHAVLHVLRLQVPAVAQGDAVVGGLQLHGLQDPHHHTQFSVPRLTGRERQARQGREVSVGSLYLYSSLTHIITALLSSLDPTSFGDLSIPIDCW